MCMNMPIGQYNEIGPDQPLTCVKERLATYGYESHDFGYVVEVSYRVPPELHDAFDDVPAVKGPIEDK